MRALKSSLEEKKSSCNRALYEWENCIVKIYVNLRDVEQHEQKKIVVAVIHDVFYVSLILSR
jgi:hypothetical protein